MTETGEDRAVNVVFYSLSGGVNVTIATVPFANPAAAQPLAQILMARIRDYKIHAFGYFVVDVNTGEIVDQG